MPTPVVSVKLVCVSVCHIVSEMFLAVGCLLTWLLINYTAEGAILKTKLCLKDFELNNVAV